MIPWFQFTEFYIGPVRIYVWGLMVALGVLVAIVLATREAKQRGLDHKAFADAAFWIIVWSFIGARLGHVFFYEWAYYSQNLFEIFKVWHGGLSSYGGFIFGALAGWWQLKKYSGKLLSYADCVAWGMAPGWAIGRIGCFLIHDHPGTLTDFALAVQQPDGGARHDLGLYDALLALAIFIVLILARRAKPKNGTLLILTMGMYGVVRFFLDFLRATDIPAADARYFGLTPAQYFSILMVFGAVYLFRKKMKRT